MKKIMLSLALALSACAATIPNSRQVAIRASHDMKCDVDKVQTTALDARSYRASACGQEQVYDQRCTSSDVSRCTWVPRSGTPSAAASGGSVGQ